MSWSFAEALLFLTPGVPVAVAALWVFAPLRSRLVPLVPWAALPGLILTLTPFAEGPSWAAGGVLAGLHLGLDGPGRAFLFLAALLWLLSGLFALGYHRADPARERFFGLFALTMTGNLGLTVAADAVSFYLFFACMTFAAYGLIVHHRDPQAFRAGRIYIVLAVVGEVGVLAALFLLGSAAGGVPGFGSDLVGGWAVLAENGQSEWVAGLVVVGFGVKAGLVPLHMWLPLAHPVAPTAASALLSGAMIKGGLLAWLRYLPPEGGLPVAGGVLIAIGAGATLYGVVVGLTQVEAKTVLAYSSVSQMGFMAIGAGLLARSSQAAPAALLAVVAYGVHHGVSKGALFLSVGVADRLRGGPASDGRTVGPPARVARRMVLIGAALPALALSGAPFSMGAQSKGALKAAISDLGPGLYPVLDPLLLLAGAGTTVLMARFLWVLSGRMRDDGKAGEASSRRSSGWPLDIIVPWAVLVAVGLAGPWWLPRLLPTSWASMLPGPSYGWLGAAAPVAIAAVIASAVARRPTLLGKVGQVRVPPGDILLPLERWAGRVARLFRQSPGSSTRRRTPSLRGAGLRVGSWIAALARMDLRLAAGRFVAPMLLALLLLALATLLL